MKVLLAKPISRSFIITPPVGLGYLATALRKSGHDPLILDCVKEHMDIVGLKKTIRELQPDVVGFTMFSIDLESVGQSLRAIKEIDPSITTLLGGPHPSAIPVECMEQMPEADFGFKGEAEIGLPRLLDHLEGNQSTDLADIPGLIWRNGSGITVNSQEFYEDLDRLGLPAWDLMPPDSYPYAPHQGIARRFPTAPIIITRGCPYNCSFCATRTITGTRIRKRSVNNVIEEIKLLCHEYRVKEIHIEDDNFTFYPDLVKSFCKHILEERIDITWHCSSGVRVNSMDEEMLELMKKSGCYTVTIAIESGVQRVLELMKKNITLEEIEKEVTLLNKAGFKPTGLFMIGFPGETREDILATVDFALRLDLKRTQFAIFHPMPGTEIFEKIVRNGELKKVDWSKIHPSGIAYSPVGISKKELRNLQRYAFLKFHLRPRIIYYLLKELTSFRNFQYVFRRIFSMLIR